jgi:cytochrome c peroxidase
MQRQLPGTLIACGFVALAACAGLAPSDSDTDLLQQARAIFKPLPAHFGDAEHPVTPERVVLGRMLFFDTRISLDGTSGCARCHQPFLYGTDGLAKVIGVKDRMGRRNAPTVLNAALQISQHWNGDRASPEDQAMKSLLGPPSFGNPDYAAAMARINAIPGYRASFEKVFPGEKEPVTPENWAKAIGAYVRTLVTPDPFDAFLNGDANALSPRQQTGLRKFITTGCAGCHGGVGLGGGTYQKFGIFEEYWKATGSKTLDRGYIEVTNDPAHLYFFKVPPLRNVAMTPPYFHDGSVASLSEAVKIMARLQLGKTPSDEDVGDIVAFLNSLTGKLPKDFVTVPILPAAAFN